MEKSEKREQRPDEVDIMVPVLDVVAGAFSANRLRPVSVGAIRGSVDGRGEAAAHLFCMLLASGLPPHLLPLQATW